MSDVTETDQQRFTSRDDLLSTFDGDAEFVRELVLGFLDRVPVLMAAIESGLNARDRGAISHAAHDLKGSLGYFDQGLNLATARRIEKIASADLAEGPDLFLQLQEGLGFLKRHLTEQFDTRGDRGVMDLGPAN